jgi:hypothetical protein
LFYLPERGGLLFSSAEKRKNTGADPEGFIARQSMEAQSFEVRGPVLLKQSDIKKMNTHFYDDSHVYIAEAKQDSDQLAEDMDLSSKSLS